MPLLVTKGQKVHGRIARGEVGDARDHEPFNKQCHRSSTTKVNPGSEAIFTTERIHGFAEEGEAWKERVRILGFTLVSGAV